MSSIQHSGEPYCKKHTDVQFLVRTFVCPLCKSSEHTVPQDYNNLGTCRKHPEAGAFRAENDPR